MAYCNPYMGISKNKGTPKWMVYNGKPYQKWMIWAENLPIFGNTHIIWAVQSLLKPTVLVTASITVADYFLMSQKKKTWSYSNGLPFVEPKFNNHPTHPLMILVFFISKFKNSRPTPSLCLPKRSLPQYRMGKSNIQKRPKKKHKV